MKRARRGQPKHRRTPLLAVALLATVTTACADEVDEPIGAPVVDELDEDFGPDPSLVGLEVSARGDVTEVAAPIAFRIDRDGIGGGDEEPEGDDPEAFDDEDFGDLALVDEGVPVIDVRETDVAEGDSVEVTGTVRRFELEEAERLFDIDLGDVYEVFDDELVIVADEVVVEPTVSTGGSTTSTTTGS